MGRGNGLEVVRSPAVKLALVGPSWPLRGGIARTTTALAQALASRGTLAAFVVPKRQYPRLLYPGGGDTDAAACRRLDAADAVFGVVEPWTWGRAVRAVMRAGPDLLLLPYWTWVWAPFARRLICGSGLETVCIVHNPADHDASPLAQRAAHSVLGRCGGFFCHAHSVAARLETLFPGKPTAVHPLPHANVLCADRAASRSVLGVPEGSVAALFFGLIRPYKGLDVLLDALALVPEGRRLVLLVAGEPWGVAGRELRRRLADPALARRVVARLEWVPEAEAATWFAAADLAVLPYRSATGSAVAAQALAYGLPVVGSRVGGIAEVVEDGVSGLLVPPEDPAALAAALVRLCDRDKRARLADGARAAAARWSWDSYAAVLEELARAVGGGVTG